MSTVTESRRIVPIALWIGILATLVVLWMTGQAHEAWFVIRDAQMLPLALVGMLGMTMPIIHAVRWQIIMRSMGIDMSTGHAVNMTVSASLLNYASPGFVGVPAKAFLANRCVQAPYRHTLLAITCEQALDFAVLLTGSTVAIAVIGPRLLTSIVSSTSRQLEVAAFIVVGMAVAGLAITGWSRINGMLSRLFGSIGAIWNDIDHVPVATLTLIYWLLQVAVVALLLVALRLPMSVEAILALATIPLLVGQVVPLPGGIGAREGAIVALSEAIAASATGMLGLAILQRFLLVAALPVSLGLLRLLRSIPAGGHP